MSDLPTDTTTSGTTTPPRSKEAAKQRAKELRAQLAAQGSEVGHARSLELVAHQFGFRDWNAMNATLEAETAPVWTNGARVTGSYLSHPFTGSVLTCEAGEPGWHYLELQLDEAIDVVASDSFSNFRRRVRGLVGPKGYSQEKTSDGAPHLQVELAS